MLKADGSGVELAGAWRAGTGPSGMVQLPIHMLVIHVKGAVSTVLRSEGNLCLHNADRGCVLACRPNLYLSLPPFFQVLLFNIHDTKEQE